MTVYASLDDLKSRLDWELSTDEERAASAALEDASDHAAYYGRDWPADTAPRLVRTVVLAACKRYMSNPDGFVQSRAGDETLVWSEDREAGSVHFTEREITLLRALAGKNGLTSVGVTAWGPQVVTTWDERPTTGTNGHVPIQGAGKSFPLFEDNGSEM